MMAAYQVLLLNTAIPQIQAAQSGDTYVVPRDIAINATAIISANSATDALRITQIGAGNAILVEDSANPDSTPFVVTATGDVGIGTASPKMEVQTKASGGIQAASDVELAIRYNMYSSGGDKYIQASNKASSLVMNLDGDFLFYNTNTASTAANSAVTGLAERLRITSTGTVNIVGGGTPGSTQAVSFNGSAPVDSLVLNSSGNLGLGVTPSAWAVYKSFDSGSCSFNTAGVQGELTSNGFFNASSQWIYKATGFANRYVQNLSATGVHSWHVAPSGTAGDPITFTQALTLDGIDGSGYGKNLKLGGTADRATTKGTHHFDIFDGTAPVGTLANGISLYSSSGEAYVMDAAGNATLFSPHDAETNEWIFRSKHTPTGKVLKIDVEKMLRFINDHFGLDAIHEFTE
jgi:hypothetical protein